MEQNQVSKRRACNVLKIDRSMIRYLSQGADDFELRDIIKRASWEQRRFVCRLIHVMIARKGFGVNHKKVRRIDRAEKLRCSAEAAGNAN